MNLSQFLMLNGVIVTLLLVSFFVFRGKKTPARLNFKKPRNSPLQRASDSIDPEGTSLNAMFNFNGHSFDAYEVLGVPAGSTLEEVRSFYEQTLRVSDKESQEFYRMAFEAIRARHSSQK